MGHPVSMSTRNTPPQTKNTVVRDLTADPQPRLVQAGWQVRDRAGVLIGDVIDRGIDDILVAVAAREGYRARISTSLIAEEDERAKRVTLAVDGAELESLRPLQG